MVPTARTLTVRFTLTLCFKSVLLRGTDAAKPSRLHILSRNQE